nr:unnamed protein product [Callosobruchus chinensis]
MASVVRSLRVEVIPLCKPGRSAPRNIQTITQSRPRAPNAKNAAGQPQELEQISPVIGRAIMFPNTEPKTYPSIF